ncbi:hypothetical protein Tco_1310923 [Tanacetum coccineum]
MNEPTEVELKELPPHLEYAFLEGDNKLPVIIAKELDVEEKSALVKVLKSHKRALAWNFLTSGYQPGIMYHKILMVEDYAPASLGVSPIIVYHRGGMTVVVIRGNELIPTRLVTGWRCCIDYLKLNEATRKGPLPSIRSMDQML